MSALVANADYYRRNLFGKCQNLTARVELSPSPGGGKPDVDVKVSHTDPWIGDSHRTSRRVFLDSDSTSLEAIHAKAEPSEDDDDADDVAAAGDGPKALYVRKVISGVEYRGVLFFLCAGRAIRLTARVFCAQAAAGGELDRDVERHVPTRVHPRRPQADLPPRRVQLAPHAQRPRARHDVQRAI